MVTTIFESYVRKSIYEKYFKEIYMDFTKFIEKFKYIDDIPEILENMAKYDNCIKIKIDLGFIKNSQNICNEYFEESFKYEYIGCSKCLCKFLYMIVFFNLTEKRDYKMFLIKDYTLSKFYDIMANIDIRECDEYWFMAVKKNTLIEDMFHTVISTLYSDDANKRSVRLNQYMLNYVSSV